MGASGGLIIIWNSSVFVGTPWYVDSFAVGVSFAATQSSDSWKLINVYGPCSGQRRVDFTNWLFDLNIPDDENWLILRDFNFIRSTNNRNKPGGDAADMLLSAVSDGVTCEGQSIYLGQHARRPPARTARLVLFFLLLDYLLPKHDGPAIGETSV